MTQIQLSDTQAVILSAACARDDRIVFPVTTTLKGGAINAVLGSLLKKGLVEEIPAMSEATVWRHGDDDTPLTLRATKEALARLRPPMETGEDLVVMCYRSADFQEGMEAFLAKRPPQWRGE